MSLRSQFFSLFLLAAMLVGTLLALYLARVEYQAGYDRLIEQAQARILSHPELQIAIYRENKFRLNKTLDELSKLPAVSVAAAWSSSSKLLSSSNSDNTPDTGLPPLPSVRGDASIADAAIIALSPAGDITSTSFWAALMPGDARIHLTKPVISSVNPARQGLTAQDFYESMSEPRENGSLRVMGYVQVVIERSVLLQRAFSTLTQFFIGYLLLLAAMTVAAFYSFRHATSPLSQLKQLADDIIAGQSAQELQLDSRHEFHKIARVMNLVVSNEKNYRSDIEVDRKLLAMKVDESKSKLSQRDDELDEATRQINAAKDHLHKLAYYDSLTSLPNRTLFSEQLRLLLKMNERQQRPLALLCLDLKNFSRINDSLGHKTGDNVLAEVSQRLTRCLRSSDMLAHYVEAGPRIDVSRLGGDEFSIVLNQLDDAKTAALVAQRVIDSLAEPISASGHELVVTPSIGIAIAPRDADNVEGLVRAAGIAKNQARAAPSEDFLFYQDDMDVVGQGHFKLEGELRKAIERNQLTLLYQPQVDTADGSIACAEALLRWEHPEYGEVPPFRFIPMAEEIGMIEELGNWVLDKACRQLKEFRDQGLELPRIAVNVSAIQFNAGFSTRVRNTLTELDLSPDSLELGLAEGILMEGNSETTNSLEALRRHGVHLSLDNFGISSTPLSYLSKYPINELKIDRHIVTNCDSQQDNASLVKAIIAIGRTLNLRTVAEGVESQGEYRFLADQGMRTMQGYLFSKPVNATQLQAQLAIPWHYMSQVQQLKLAADFARGH